MRETKGEGSMILKLSSQLPFAGLASSPLCSQPDLFPYIVRGMVGRVSSERKFSDDPFGEPISEKRVTSFCCPISDHLASRGRLR